MTTVRWWWCPCGGGRCIWVPAVPGMAFENRFGMEGSRKQSPEEAVWGTFPLGQLQLRPCREGAVE